MHDKLAQLRERFRQRVIGERTTLGELVAALQADPSDATAAGDLRQRAHRIAGTASNVGLENLGAAAKRLETALDAGEGEAAREAADAFLAEVAHVADQG